MTEDVKDLLNHLLRAVEYEREAERSKHETEIKQLTGAQREAKGRALIAMKSRRSGRALGGDYLYTFKKLDASALPENQLSVGDQVIVSQYDPLDLANPTATIYDMTRRSMTLAFSHILQLSNTRPFRIDLHVNDITFQRMEQALSAAKSGQYSKLHALLSGYYQVNSQPKGYRNVALNDVQMRALDFALSNNGYYSVQGPPGTGKTHTAAHLIAALVAADQRILITADSNAALDNLIRKLTDLSLDPLRIGNPIRVNSDLKNYTIDYKLLDHVLYNDYLKTEQEIAALQQQQKSQLKPTPRYTRGLKPSQLVDIVKSGQTQHGLSKKSLKKFTPWLTSQLNLDKLYDQLNEIKDDIKQALLASHQIVAATNSTAGSDLLAYEKFDWLVIDEAAQASIPSSLIAILKAERFVLFGDHFQLPPVVLSQEAKQLGLAQSLMALLAEKYPYQLTMLEMQYRMNQPINNLVSTMFYRSKLIAAPSVKQRSIDDHRPIIETVNLRGEERVLRDSKSYYNESEMLVVERQINRLKRRGVPAHDIAVISPYKAQTKLLRQRLEPLVEVDTVDAFQGREKDVVIISFVRSNDYQGIGFLKDYRRLNVSISRAKKKLILIGDFDTLANDALYQRLFSHIAKSNSGAVFNQNEGAL